MVSVNPGLESRDHISIYDVEPYSERHIQQETTSSYVQVKGTPFHQICVKDTSDYNVISNLAYEVF